MSLTLKRIIFIVLVLMFFGGLIGGTIWGLLVTNQIITKEPIHSILIVSSLVISYVGLQIMHKIVVKK